MLNDNMNFLAIRDLWAALLRRWKLVLAIFTITVVVFGVKTFTAPKLYRATAKVLLRREDRLGELSPTYTRLTQEEEIKSELEIASSRPVLAKVLDDMLRQRNYAERSGVNFMPIVASKHENSGTLNGTAALLSSSGVHADTARTYEMLLSDFRNRMTVEAIAGSNVIEISYDDPEPDQAQWLANALAKSYSAYNAQVYGSQNADQFLQERIQRTYAQLDSMEGRLAQARIALGLVSLDKRESALLEKYKSFDGQLTQIREEREMLAAGIQRLQQVRNGGDSLIIPTADMDNHPAVRQLYGNLLEYRLQRNTLLEKYRPDHRKVKDLNKSLDGIGQQLTGEIDRLRRLEEERLAALRLEEKALAKIVAGLQADLQGLPEKERELSQLELAVENSRKLYSILVTRQEEMSVEKATDPRISRVSVISAAGLPLYPISPRKSRDLALGIMLGLLGGVAAGLIAEFSKDKIKSPRDFAVALGAPTLGTTFSAK